MARKTNQTNQQSSASQTPWEKYQNRYQNEPDVKKNRFKKGLAVKWNATILKFCLTIICLLLILVFLIYLVSPLSRVANRSVSGNSKLSANHLVTTIPIKKGDSVIHTFNHRSQLEKQFLKQNPQVKSATLTINNFNNVNFKVVEYGTAGYLYSKDKYYIVVDNGEIINRYLLSPSSDLPIFVNFKPNSNLKSIAIQYNKLSKTIKNNIIKIQKDPTSYDPNRIKITMHDKNIVYAKSETFASKMSYYPSIVSKIKKPSIINLEVGAYSYPIKNKK
ncbi:cell division protein FtsQ/DivIB [Lactobacillus sp. Sy-1]|uniref:cell division protein FtsQ/DivIB n=1 Tax=Lactobacillus sp. Sy-1 TaxID=2109645 RepID=UPI001C5A00DE|nr:cell division protein FtsQ/DivIB [Lactobacillus sp. Sy-1]MBW1605413.1 FtsQ-type POTRA domain-containing protein [Lactobacillus sp. Sy-1]